MAPTFRPYDGERDVAALVDLLTTERWTHRVKHVLTEADAREELDNGVYSNPDVLMFLVEVDGEVVGYVRAEDVGRERSDPQLDFRLRERVRGRGIGLLALRHITREIFERFAQTTRIEGQTRRDNVASAVASCAAATSQRPCTAGPGRTPPARAWTASATQSCARTGNRGRRPRSSGTSRSDARAERHHQPT